MLCEIIMLCEKVALLQYSLNRTLIISNTKYILYGYTGITYINTNYVFRKEMSVHTDYYIFKLNEVKCY